MKIALFNIVKWPGSISPTLHQVGVLLIFYTKPYMIVALTLVQILLTLKIRPELGP